MVRVSKVYVYFLFCGLTIFQIGVFNEHQLEEALPFAEDRIIFSARYGSMRNIYELDVAKLSTSKLTTDIDVDSNISISPDHKMFAFSAINEYGWNIYVSTIEGTIQHALTHDDGTYPSWSPDGSHLAFISIRTGRPKLYLMDKDGSNEHQLLDLDVRYAPPRWSSDSKQIAITSLPNRILIVNAEELTFYELSDYAWLPFWSPDGKTIGYSGWDVGDKWSILLINSDATDKRNLTLDFVTDAWFMNWSPDGSYVSFVSTNPIDNLASIYISDFIEQKSEEIIPDIELEPTALWSPDANFLASVKDCEGEISIYIISVDKTTEKCISIGNVSDIVLSAWID